MSGPDRLPDSGVYLGGTGEMAERLSLTQADTNTLLLLPLLLELVRL